MEGEISSEFVLCARSQEEGGGMEQARDGGWQVADGRRLAAGGKAMRRSREGTSTRRYLITAGAGTKHRLGGGVPALL